MDDGDLTQEDWNNIKTVPAEILRQRVIDLLKEYCTCTPFEEIFVIEVRKYLLGEYDNAPTS